MQLVLLVLLLIGPYLLLDLVARARPGLATTPSLRARAGVSLLFAFTGAGHFVETAAMTEMLPPFVPYRTELIYVTGVFELLGAVGIWLPRLRPLAGLALIAMLIGVLPSNVYAAFAHVSFGGHELGPVYLLVRVPFQFLTIWWVYRATLQPLRNTQLERLAARLRPTVAGTGR
jgi:uncharacterized membrane protein